MRRAIPLLLFAFAACSNERRAQHEALAKKLEAPMSLLCQATHKESASCVDDCAVRAAASEGKAARDAADAFAAIPPFGDVETEGMLADVRKSARALKKAFGDACKEAPAADGPPTDAVRDCADARKLAGFNISDLNSVVTRLAGNAETRTGAKMPAPTPDGCAKLGK
jgi:hypothetical protein